MALCVVMEESEGLATAHLSNEVEDSRGLFQLNVRVWGDGEWPGGSNRPIPPLDAEAAFDPLYNARYALEVFEKWGWEPWTTSEVCAGRSHRTLRDFLGKSRRVRVVRWYVGITVVGRPRPVVQEQAPSKWEPDFSPLLDLPELTLKLLGVDPIHEKVERSGDEFCSLSN